MKNMVAYCGIECSKCPTYIAGIDAIWLLLGALSGGFLKLSSLEEGIFKENKRREINGN